MFDLIICQISYISNEGPRDPDFMKMDFKKKLKPLNFVQLIKLST